MGCIRHVLIFFVISLTLISLFLPSQGLDEEPQHHETSKPSSPFTAALEALQKQIGYNFQKINLLRRAMTHPSFSGENNRALSILGLNVIETSISLRCVTNDIDISSKDLSRRLTKISEVNSCANQATRLGLQNIIRVSLKTNSSAPAVVCGGFRAIFGAIAVDSGKADDAGNVFLSVHRGSGGGGGEYSGGEGISAFAF